jgi:hypothetical protein
VAKYQNTIEYNIKTSLDKSGINALQAELAKLKTQFIDLNAQGLFGSQNKDQISGILDNLNKLDVAMQKAFDTKLGVLNFKKFSAELNNSRFDLQKFKTDLSLAGVQGEKTFTSFINQMSKANSSAITLSTNTQKIFNTFGNTLRWGATASIFQGMMNSIHSSVEYMKDLDESLTNIMMVTDYSRDAMNEYAKSANEAAQALGSTTVAMTDATLVFAQQGFDLDKSQQLATLSTKLANASQQDTATTSDQITAYMNAYGMDTDMEQLSLALDKWAEVANVSAADVEELATASQKAASTANTVGISMDQLAAQIATIESVTREAPENMLTT